MDNIFYNGDGRRVHCAVNLDDHASPSYESLDNGLDRAVDRGETIELYAHRPGTTVKMSTLEHVLAGARERGLPFVTYGEFAAGGGNGPGLALSLDDASIDEWEDAMPLFEEYGARVTFFVTRYARLNEDRRAQLRSFVARGHELQAHGVEHLDAPIYVEERGLAAYLVDEAVPSILALRDDGYEIDAFAYPFGTRTQEIDDALLKHVKVLRSVSFPYHWPIQDACP